MIVLGVGKNLSTQPALHLLASSAVLDMAYLGGLQIELVLTFPRLAGEAMVKWV